MKNISYFCDFGSNQRSGGSYSFARELFCILNNLPVNLTVFALFCPKIDKEIPIKSSNIIPVSVPSISIGNIESGLVWMIKIRSLLRKISRQDLYVFDHFAAALPQLSFIKTPAVAMFHGSDKRRIKDLSLRHPRTLIRDLLWSIPVLNRIQRGFIKKKFGTPLFNSRFTLQRISEDFRVSAGPLEKYVTYLPVAVEKYERDESVRWRTRKKLGISDDGVVISYIANFSSAKRADRVPPMVLRIIKKFPKEKIRFVFVGRKIISKPIDALIDNPLTRDYCIRIDEVPAEKVRDFYSASDIAISTSESETFGYSICEGMSSKLPFVAYKVGALPELIEHNKTGFLVENENQFVSALSYLIKKPEIRKKMGECGYDRVKKFFSREAFTKRFVKIINEEFNFSL